MWTIRAALEWTEGFLGRKGIADPRVSAQWLLAQACGLSRIELYANFDKPLSPGEREVLRGYVARRGEGVPLQYITGEVGFRHVTVKVREGVLIPRPETEVLVSEALAMLPPAARTRAVEDPSDEEASEAIPGYADDPVGTGLCPVRSGGENSLEAPLRQVEYPTGTGLDPVRSGSEDSPEAPFERAGDPSRTPDPLLAVDLCTGTGCIACSLAYEHPDVRVVATDISPAAVALARENVAALGLTDRVAVKECDLGAGIPERMMGKVDLVVSNPPYIPTAVLAGLDREVVDFEPALALDGGPDGLDLFRRMLPWCARALKPGGAAAFELHETCLDAAAHLAEQHGFAEPHITHDLTRRPRILTFRKPPATPAVTE